MLTPRRIAVGTVLLVILAIGWVLRRPPQPPPPFSPAPDSLPAAPTAPPGSPPGQKPAADGAPATPAGSADSALTEAEALVAAHKKIDREHLAALRTGIFAYREKYGRYPEYLSQLAPEFVRAETLISPHKKAGSRDFADMDHPDPGMTEPSYGYEFSNLEFRDGRTFAEIKEVQRAEWGDVVPLLRCFAYDGTVLNMAYGGEVYETALNWEWDSATLDLVDKYGWGPGLDSGETVRVQVTGPDGQAVPGAKVWADGRNYSFDLPNRPFPVDAEGYAVIPVGADVDRTRLSLRAEAPGLSSPLTRYAAGELPVDASLSLAAAETIGGVALGSDGQPLAHARIFLKTAGPQTEGGFPVTGNDLVSVVSDAGGKWQAAVNPADLPNLTALIGVGGGSPVKYSNGQPLDSAAAIAGKAEVRSAP